MLCFFNKLMYNIKYRKVYKMELREITSEYNKIKLELDDIWRSL